MSRAEYEALAEDPQQFRAAVDELLAQYPALFPAAMAQGYHLYGRSRRSVKMPDLRLRRICLNEPDQHGRRQVYTVAPSGVLPYMAGETDAVEKALFLRRFGVPFWGLTYVFGRNDMYWQRLVLSLGRNELVSTSVKAPDRLPQHLLADEKHSRLNGQKAYIATTVADECILGASLALAADEAQLTEAYGCFRQEARRLNPSYHPETVNTDGWSPTQLAWQALFPAITIILCFLHAFLSIRARGKHLKDTFRAIQQQVWDIYRAETVDHFRQQIADLQAWASLHVTGPTLSAILKLCANAPRFALAFDHPHACRTSNMLDRHMDPLDRCLYAAHYFHGHRHSAEYQVRAWALLHNFQPYCPRSQIRLPYRSPFHRLNGFVYHENWLHNLLIAASLGHRYSTNAIR